MREHDVEVAAEVLQHLRVLIAVADDHCRIEPHEGDAVGRHAVEVACRADCRLVELVEEALDVLGLAVRHVAEDKWPEAEELHELEEMGDNRRVIDAGEGILDEENALPALFLRKSSELLRLVKSLDAKL